MIWNKYFIEDRKISGISIFSVLLIIVSLYMQSKLVFFLAVFFLTISLANYWYLRKAGNLLYLENNLVKNRFFIKETGQWKLQFKNEGYPILKGEIRLYFDHFVAPEGEKVGSSLSQYELPVSFSIFKNQTKQISIPFTAEKRGIARIRKIEIHIPSLFGFGETIIESKRYLNQQAIVYPTRMPVVGLRERYSIHQGSTVVPHSYFEDRLGPIGTRNYVSSDSFNRIHWKATARKQELQTKIYEKISESSWSIVLNISDGHSITGNLEKLISGITEFAYFAFSKNIPYSLSINVRTAGSTPFLYIPKAEGSEHLQKVLETLASVGSQSSSIPFVSMLSFIYRHIDHSPYYVHAGVKTQEATKILFQLGQKGIKLYELKLVNEQGVLTDLLFQRKGEAQGR